MAKTRVHEIAKKYNKQSKEIIEILKKNNIEVKKSYEYGGRLPDRGH
ncbi:translation initiation factor IF-2 N-terminal domain-containing protein [Anaerostipes caccae]|nr:translation initiation factor IF-2 N-terminal domain-containing protein [Anaerostipes caccae]